MDALMEAKREPLKRMQKEVALEKQQKSSWADITQRLSTLRDAARSLYSFQNPFNDRIASSSDDKTLDATATRQAIEETKQITVRKVATADRFLSQSLPRDFAVDPGDYAFRVGDKEVRLAWKGGSLKAFADALNAKGGDTLSASVVNDTPSTQVLLIESKLTGVKNRLTLQGAAADLGVKTGMLERSLTASRQVQLSDKTLSTWTTPPAPGSIQIQNGTITLNPGSEIKVPVSPAATLNKNMVLELSVKVEHLPETPPVEVQPPPGPNVPSTGGINFQGIQIQSEPSKTPLPPWTPPKPPEKVDDLQMLFMEADGQVIPLPPVSDSTDFQKIQIPVGEQATSLSALDLRNRNTYRRLSVKDISLFDKTQRGDYVPKKALDQAGDAVITVDGVDCHPAFEHHRRRPPLRDAEPEIPQRLAGHPHRQARRRGDRKKQVMGLVGAYNRTVTQIDVLSRNDPQIIDDASYLSDDEKKKAQNDLGLLMGDMISLMQLKNSLQDIMMNPYLTSLGRDMRLLAQIGISTDARALGSLTLDKTKLRGYLEID